MSASSAHLAVPKRRPKITAYLYRPAEQPMEGTDIKIGSEKAIRSKQLRGRRIIHGCCPNGIMWFKDRCIL